MLGVEEASDDVRDRQFRLHRGSRSRISQAERLHADSQHAVAELSNRVARMSVSDIRDDSREMSPPGVALRLIDKRPVLAGVIGGRVVGPASLDGSVVRTVFVSPEVQRRGIGKLLMAEVERTARERNILSLTVPSSVSAETFYALL